MPEVTRSSIEDVRLGTQKVGALMSGDLGVYVRLEKITYNSPGNFSTTLPEWASAYAVVLSGGGGGGQAGDASLNRSGRGGNGGTLTGFTAVLGTASSRRINLTVGVGGAGGTETAERGSTGGTTKVVDSTGSEWTAAGGTAYRSEPEQDGLRTQARYAESFNKWFDLPIDAYYPTGPEGTGNGGSGTRGGGGAGGNGGVFGSYTKGGKGGDGFVDIYVWGLPPDEAGDTVKLTGTSGMTSRYQLRDAVTARGLDYRTVTHLPFNIDTSQATSLLDLFNGWAKLKIAPDMDTRQVTDMGGMFRGCTALNYVGDLQTSNVTNAGYMFNSCPALTDGNVRLIGKRSNVDTTAMITNSGLTRLPFYNSSGNPI